MEHEGPMILPPKSLKSAHFSLSALHQPSARPLTKCPAAILVPSNSGFPIFGTAGTQGLTMLRCGDCSGHCRIFSRNPNASSTNPMPQSCQSKMSPDTAKCLRAGTQHHCQLRANGLEQTRSPSVLCLRSSDPAKLSSDCIKKASPGLPWWRSG